LYAKDNSQDYRSLLVNALLFVFASINETTPDGQRWLGEDEWNELDKKDSIFHEEMRNRRDGRDETYYNEMFLCSLQSHCM